MRPVVSELKCVRNNIAVFSFLFVLYRVLLKTHLLSIETENVTTNFKFKVALDELLRKCLWAENLS